MKKIAAKVGIGFGLAVLTSVHPAPNRLCKATIEMRFHNNGKVIKAMDATQWFDRAEKTATLYGKEYEVDSVSYHIKYK